jgi:hypothetical protein
MVKLKLVFILVCLLLISSSALAGQKEIEVTFDKKEISLGSSIRMDMVFFDAVDMPVPEIPQITGLNISYLRSTDAISKVDGSIKRGKRYTYLIIPERPGIFSIGPLSFIHNGIEYVSDKLDIRINSGLSRITEDKTETASEEELKVKENAFLIIASDKDKVYVNEVFQIAAALYYRDVQITDIEYPKLNHEGFSISEFRSPQASRKQIKGYDYRIITFRNSAFAIRPGELYLGPAGISCSTYVQDLSRPSDSLSGNTQRKTTLNLESKARTITVLPFPQEGKPESFRGAVGDFQLSLDVEPSGFIKTGSAITLSMEISGNGNFNMVSAPIIKENENFIFYSPGIEDESDTYKRFKQTIIPKNASIKEIPEIEFSFFDPHKEKYTKIKKGPIAIKVFETATEKSHSIIDTDEIPIDNEIEQEPIGEGIIYIKEKTSKFSKVGIRLYKDKMFICLQLLPLFLYLTTVFLYKRHKRFKEDIAYARLKMSQSSAKTRLRQAYSILSSGNAEKFYAYIFESIQEYFGNKFNLPAAGMTSDIIARFLKARDADPSIIAQVKKFFDECYLARFTPYRYEKKDMLIIYEAANSIVENCKRI